MSSDVYIDIGNVFSGDPPIDTARIGHLGTLTFKTNVVKWLGLLSAACPIVTEHVIVVASAMFALVSGDLADMEGRNPDWLAQMGIPEDFQDLLGGDEIEEFLRQHIDQTWSVRVD